MAVTLLMRIPELSPEHYDSVLPLLELDANPPAGLLLHLASEAAGAINIYEVWQTPQAAESFIEKRLRVVLAHQGLTEPLAYRCEPMRNLFAPGMDFISWIGCTSLAADGLLAVRRSSA